MLSAGQVEQFVEEGFVRLDGAFPRAIADEGRAALWEATGCDPDDPATWTRPVVRVMAENDRRGDQPLSFRAAANTRALHEAFDQLVGPGRWKPRPNVGLFVVRFPSQADPGDTGWHIDQSFPPPGRERTDRDYAAWRVNIASKDRALLALFLFSDVGEEDAPTRILVGSHQDMARLIAPYGEEGVAPQPLAHAAARTRRPPALATGEAGTVYLCHPFLIHAAQRHHGKRPRFMSQPPLEPAAPFSLERGDGAYCPVEEAIRRALR